MFAGAMAVLMVLSAVNVSGWSVMNAKAEETAVQVNDSAGKTEQQSTEEEECKHEGVEITFNSNGFGNCPKCNAIVYQPAVETTDKYDIDDDSMKETVYEISNAGQLYWFAGLVNGTLDGVKQNTLANAILMKDITVNDNLLDSLQYDAEGNVSNGSDFITWTPIADCMEDHITLYSGTFDGNNKTVSGLYFNDNSTRIGLFGSSEADGNIKNVGVVDSYFKGNDFVGGVCGRNDGTITNCYNAGNLTAIESSATIGGICGYNSGTVTNCYNTGTVTATGQVASVGGVCGCSTAPISNCYNIGTVTATSSSTDISDICGYNFGPVTNCYYLADTEDEDGGKTAAQFVSGEVAYLLNGSKSEGDTVHFYQIIGKDKAPVLDKSHGVVYFYTDCTDKTCYANSETASGEHDFDENGFCAKDSTHYQPATLNETTGNYEISNAGQLYWFAGLVNGTLDGVEQNTSANAILMEDITVNDNLLDSLQYDTEGNVSNGSDFITWTPIADWMGNRTTQYSGTFDGNNKTVSGLYFNGDSTCIGLFGSSESDGNIKNVGVVDSYFKGNDHVGGVCGNNAGTITNCYNAGNLTAIESSANIGGICGYNNGGTVTNCYNTGTVTATGSVASVGGVCGCSIAPISNCYNIGTVTATSSDADISGICGYYFGPIKNCYYLADTEDENGGKTTAQFASGEVAYLLSQGCTVVVDKSDVTYDGSIWGQKLGENGDTYPVLKKAGDAKNTVYRNEAYPGCEGNPGDPVYSYSNTQKAPAYAEHTDEDLDGKCDVGGEDFKTYNQLGKLITKVKLNLSDGKYADVQYTTASIDNLRKALVAAGAITEASSDTDVATAFDKLLAASTVGADGLIAADHNIVISFADAKRGIASGNGWYANGDTVTLKVTPSVGYIFSKWTTDKAGNTSVGTESTYTFTLGADSPDEYYAWLDEVKYTVTCESVEGGAGKASEEQYVYGQIATVTAAANDNYEFVGWKDSYGTTVSTDAVYNFTVIGDATLTPEFVKVKTNEGADIAYVTVSFYHQSGKLLDSQKVVSGEGKITNTVNAPTKVGFDFLGWSAKASGATAEDVVDFKTATFSENTSLYPVFKAQDITYTLTVGSQTEQKAPQSSVTVTADPIDGKQFVGWKDANGNIVSYDSTYTFIITGDTTLTAYYEQVDSEVVKEPTIVIGEPVISVKEQGVSKKATMYFNYDIPSGNELVDIGVVYVSGKKNTLDMNTPGVVIRSAMSTINASPNNVKNQFYYSKTMTADSEYTFMGYIVYTDSSGKRITIYSDLKNASYND